MARRRDRNRRTALRLLAVATAAAPVVAALTVVAGATAATHEDPRVDAVAADVAGFPVTVYGEDDPAAWAQAVPNDPLGFTRLSAPIVYLAPSIWLTLEQIEMIGITATPPYDSALAVLALIHEAEHQRLHSTDEGRVEACALADFDGVLERDFGVPRMATQTVTTTTYTVRRVRVWKRVRVHGRVVRRVVVVSQRVPHVTQTEEQVTNPDFDVLDGLAHGIYASGPPPYSTGSCS